MGGLAWRWVIARSPSPPPQREVNKETALTTPPHHAQSRPATRRQATPTPRPRPRTHARRSRRMHTHGAGRAGGCAWRWVVYGRSGRAGSFRTAPSILGAGETGAGETHNGERIGRACALGGQAGGTAACAARRVRARRGRAAGFAWCGDRQPQTTGDGAQRATGRVSRRPFDAAPPGSNRGAGLEPGTQVAGRRRRAVGRAAAAGSNRARGLVGYGWPRLGREAKPSGSSFHVWPLMQVPGGNFVD